MGGGLVLQILCTRHKLVLNWYNQYCLQAQPLAGSRAHLLSLVRIWSGTVCCVRDTGSREVVSTAGFGVRGCGRQGVWGSGSRGWWLGGGGELGASLVVRKQVWLGSPPTPSPAHSPSLTHSLSITIMFACERIHLILGVFCSSLRSGSLDARHSYVPESL